MAEIEHATAGSGSTLEVDRDFVDDDSTYETDGRSELTSLSSSVTAYVSPGSYYRTYTSRTDERKQIYENGRRYHAYRAGKYYTPNDEQEMDREDMKHHW